MSQHRSGATVRSSNQTFKLVVDGRTHQSCIDSGVRQHVVVVTSFDVDLQEVIGIPIVLLPGSAQSEAFLLSSIDVGDETVLLQALPQTPVDRQILPVSNVHHQALLDFFRKSSQHWMAFYQRRHPFLLFFKLQVLGAELDLHGLQLFDQLQG